MRGNEIIYESYQAKKPSKRRRSKVPEVNEIVLQTGLTGSVCQKPLGVSYRLILQKAHHGILSVLRQRMSFFTRPKSPTTHATIHYRSMLKARTLPDDLARRA